MFILCLLLVLVNAASSRTVLEDDIEKVLKIIMMPSGEEVQIEVNTALDDGIVDATTSGVNDVDIVVDTLTDEAEVDDDGAAEKRQTPTLLADALQAATLLGTDEEVLLELQLLEMSQKQWENKPFFEPEEVVEGLRVAKTSQTDSTGKGTPDGIVNTSDSDETGPQDRAFHQEYSYMTGEIDSLNGEDGFVEVVFIPKRQHTQFYNSEPELLLPKRQHTQFFNSEDDISLPKRQHTQFLNSKDDISLPKRQHTQFFNSENDISLPKRQHTQFFNSEDDIALPKRQHTQFFNSEDDIALAKRQHTQFFNSKDDISVPKRQHWTADKEALNSEDDISLLKRQHTQFFNSEDDIYLPKRQHNQFLNVDGVFLENKQENYDEDDIEIEKEDIIKVIVDPKGSIITPQQQIIPARKQHTTFYKVPGTNLLLNVVLLLREEEVPGEMRAGGTFGYTVFRDGESDSEEP